MEELFGKGFGVMIHNHLENNREITTKPGLIRSLRNFYQNSDAAVMANYQVHDTIATSFIITAQVEDMEYRQFHTRFNDIQNGYCNKEKLPIKHCEKNMWLIKPAALNQGKGIEICWNLKEIKTILKSKPMHSVWLIQKYVERPLLFKGRKFDIRIWALGTAKNDLFYYRHGYLRTSSSEYDTEATDNYIHLTNNCLQKYGENYGVHEKGNTLSFEDFQEYLDSEYPQYKLNFWTHILPRIKDLMIDSFLSAKKTMHHGKRSKVFEFFGFDFLIDEDFRVWLIEVNTNPYLGIPNEHIEKLLPKMLDDMIALMVDVHLPPKNPRSSQTNDYELLYCEVGSIYSPDSTSKNTRQPYNTSVYPVQELAQVPMCRFRPDDAPHPPPNESSKPVVRDILQTVKEELELTIVQDISDFSTICSRVMSRLNNWEIMSEEQISAGIQAFHLLAGSNGTAAFVVFNHMPSILTLATSEVVPEYIQVGILEAVAIGCQDTKFRKEVVKLEMSENLINTVLNPNVNKAIRDKAMKVLTVISTHRTKKVYIPGETREHNWVRNRIINDGVLLCFYKLGQTGEETVREEIKSHIQAEFGLADWDLQLTILDKILQDTPSESIQRTTSLKMASESGPKEFNLKLPTLLNDPKFINQARDSIRNFTESRRYEIRQKIERDKQKKLEEYEEKIRQREEEDRNYEEKRQRAEEYVNKRYEEIRKQKLEELKKQKDSKVPEEKFDENRKALIIEKIKKTEEIKRVQRMKIKKKEEDERRSEELKRKELEEKRKKVMEDWLKNKTELEKEKKLQEKLRREEEIVKRNAELQMRKEELIQKLEEKKIKEKKLREEKKEKQKRQESQVNEENSRIMLENEDRPQVVTNIPPPRHISPNMRDFRLKKKKQFDKKKRKLVSIPDQFLFDVYGSHPTKGPAPNYRDYSVMFS